MLLPMRIKTTILLVLVLCIPAYALQASAQALPGIGTVNHLAVEVIKVTTNPTDPKDTADINGPVGGDSVSIYVKVQYGNVITNINSVTVNIHESGVSIVVGTLSLTSYTQLADSGSGDATLHTRVYIGTWNTLTTTPLIYNANYCFNATVDYDRNNAHASPAVDSGEVIVPVKNLWITDITPAKYTRAYFVSSPGESHNINVDFDHYKATASYTVAITVRQTFDNDSIVETVTTPVTDKSVTISWTPSIASFPDGGYFCFDVTITCAGDNITYCSPKCHVEDDSLSCPDTSTALFNYRLNEMPKPNSITVAFYSNLEPLGDPVTNISEQERDATNPVSYDLPPGTTSVRSILSGLDNHTDNRGKREQYILPANQGHQYIIWLALHLRLNRTPPTVSDSALYVWKNCRELIPGRNTYRDSDGYPMVTARSYIANTGHDITQPAQYQRNNDDFTWVENGPSPAYNTVRENHTTEGFRPFKVNFGTTLNSFNLAKTTAHGWNDYLWRNTGAAVTFDQHQVHPIYEHQVGGINFYSNLSYNIVSANGNTSEFNKYGGGGDKRDGLWIHEDTNYAHDGGQGKVRCPGTSGCTGLVPGNMQDFHAFIHDVTHDANENNRTWRSSVNNAATTYIPYYVLTSVGNLNVTEYISTRSLTQDL